MTSSLTTKRWGLWGTWGEMPLFLGDFYQTMRSYLGALQNIHPDYKDLLFLGDSSSDSPRLETDLSNLKEWILLKACHPDHSKRSAYSHKDAEGHATTETTGDMGFSIWIVDNLFASSKGGMNVRVTAGSKALNGIQLDYYHPTRHDMINVGLQERLLQASIDHWPLEHAALTSQALIEKLEIASDSRTQNLDVGWITYSRDPVRGAILPAEIARKPFGPNGVLITAMEHEPSPDSEEDIDRLKLIRDTWNDNGLLSMTWDKW